MFRFKSSSLILTAFLVCTLAQIADVVSSMGLGGGKTTAESNPFARFGDGTFNPLHGLALKGWFVFETCLFSAVLWVAGRYLPHRLRVTLASIPFFYYAWQGLDAAFSNALYHTGWYQSVFEQGVFHLVLR